LLNRTLVDFPAIHVLLGSCYEQHADIRTAIQREKTIKHRPRAWKVRLVHGMNPEWTDLYDTLF
jgi:predicted GIY-YIG superfamily endonuclease